jgi:hypothetical protein
MAIPDPTPTERLVAADFLAGCQPEDLIYFLLNFLRKPKGPAERSSSTSQP